MQFAEEYFQNAPMMISHKPDLESDHLELLTAYRDFVDEIQPCRATWVEMLEKMRVNQQARHKLEWENQTRDQEISYLQKQIQQLQDALSRERNQMLQIAQQNENLKAQSLQNAQKEKELLGYTEPIQQEVTLQEMQAPSTVNRFPVRNEQKTIGLKPTYIIRTINMPNAQHDSLIQEIDGLDLEINQAQEKYFEDLSQLKEQKREQEDLMRCEFQKRRGEMLKLLSGIKEAQESEYAAVKDYFKLWHESRVNQRYLIEEYGKLRDQENALLRQLQDIEREKRRETTKVKKRAVKMSKRDVDHLREQTRENRSGVQAVRQQSQKLNDIYRSRVHELEMKLSSLQNKYQIVEQTKDLERQGYETEILQLEKRIDYLQAPYVEKRTERRIPVAQRPCERCEFHHRHDVSHQTQKIFNKLQKHDLLTYQPTSSISPAYPKVLHQQSETSCIYYKLAVSSTAAHYSLSRSVQAPQFLHFQQQAALHISTLYYETAPSNKGPFLDPLTQYSPFNYPSTQHTLSISPVPHQFSIAQAVIHANTHTLFRVQLIVTPQLCLVPLSFSCELLLSPLRPGVKAAFRNFQSIRSGGIGNVR